MLGQALVQEGVVGIQEIQRTAVLTDYAFEEHLRFRQHRGAKALIEIRIGGAVGLLRFQAAQMQPLAGEVGGQRLGLGIGQHARNLLLQNGRLAELALFGRHQQLFVGNAAPQEQRQA